MTERSGTGVLEIMPVRVDADLLVLNQKEFGDLAFGVMEKAFEVHNELGRFLDEAIYRDAIADRLGQEARTEVSIEVVFEEYRKRYSMDLVVANGGVFEMKAVKKLGPTHRSQLLNYLLLCGLSHGKLVNMGGERVEHEFVNTSLTLAERTSFAVADTDWKDPVSGGRSFRDWMVEFLRQIGTGLDMHLYEGAALHFFGGDDVPRQEIEVSLRGRCLGKREELLVEPGWGLRTTTIGRGAVAQFEDHLRRYVRHTSLDGIHWVNITRESVAFRSVRS